LRTSGIDAGIVSDQRPCVSVFVPQAGLRRDKWQGNNYRIYSRRFAGQKNEVGGETRGDFFPANLRESLLRLLFF
ncbi:MAG: hypothetical protein PHO37_09230, partial [Kiritimatiellae bacterium]|nr:hypothetical protein [Kiritimatiellia bacterium]